MIKILGVNVISIWEDIMGGFDFSYLLNLLEGIIPSLLCITLHELGHGYVAYRLGDTTAKDAGRLTLNPLKHIDPMGILMMLLFHFGWAKPVPVNMNRFKDPKKGMALTALAGPAANVLTALVFLSIRAALYPLLFRSSAGYTFLSLLDLTARISLGLAIFNLIPIPPLDGSKILLSFLPDRSYRVLMRYERYGSLLLIVLVWFGLLSKPLYAVIDAAYWACFLATKVFFDLSMKLFNC